MLAPAETHIHDARVRRDPTRTWKLRAKMRAEGDRRWRLVAQTLRQALIEHDLIGLRGMSRLPYGDKTEGFGLWLAEELRQKVLGFDGGWLRPYVQEAANLAQTHATSFFTMRDAYNPDEPRNPKGEWTAGIIPPEKQAVVDPDKVALLRGSEELRQRIVAAFRNKSTGEVLVGERGDLHQDIGYLPRHLGELISGFWDPKLRRFFTRREAGFDATELPAYEIRSKLMRDAGFDPNQLRGPGGEWSVEGGGVVAFHGTTDEVAQSIIKNGIKVNAAKRSFPGQDKSLYYGSRGQSIYLANSMVDAMEWAQRRSDNLALQTSTKFITLPSGQTRGDSSGHSLVVFELNIPKDKWEKFENDEVTEGVAARAEMDILPEWIVKATGYDAFDLEGGSARDIPLHDSDHVTKFMAILVSPRLKRDAMQSALDASVNSDRVAAMQSLAVSELRGIVAAAQQQIVRAIAHCLSSSSTPHCAANAVSSVVRAMRNRTRAMTDYIVVKTHATSTLSALRSAGVTHVGTVAERLRPRTRQTAHGRVLLDKRRQIEEGEDVDVVTAGDDDVCMVCEEISDGGPYELDEAEGLIPAHPWCRCIAPGTTVEGEVLAASKAFYTGPAVDIVTARGNRLTLTINHPVLTARGFVAVGDLCEGDQLVRYCGEIDGRSTTPCDKNQGPSLIENVFEALANKGVLKLGAAADDLYGDGVFLESEVDVAFSDARLMRYASTCQPQRVADFSFVAADASGSAFVRRKDLSPTFVGRHLCPLDTLLRGCASKSRQVFAQYIAFYSRFIGQAKDRFASVIALLEAFELAALEFLLWAPRYAHAYGSAKATPDDFTVEPSRSSNFVDAVSGVVEFDEVTQLIRRDYSGHVYDLQTTTGWFLAEGIVARNCAFVPLSDARFANVRELDAQWFDRDVSEQPRAASAPGHSSGEFASWGGASHGAEVSPEQAAKVKELAERTPGLKNLLPYLAPDEVNRLNDRTVKTVVDLFSSFPVKAEEMAAVAFSGSAKRGWYEKSAKAIVDVFGVVDAPRFVALMAAMSPQTGVEDNAINALNTWTNWVRAGRPTDRDQIKDVLGKSVQGEKGEESILPAWINNSVTALTSEDPAHIVLSGPKVDSFAENLRNHVNAVTLDTWMANYLGIKQNLFARRNPVPGVSPGKGPMYTATSAMVRKAAAILTERTGSKWTPAEIQETIWSWAKTLYEKATEDKTTVAKLLKAGSVTHDDIADTPDFASLFTQNVYRNILEMGGYGEQTAALAAGGGESGGGHERGGSLLEAEGSGFAPDAFVRHLNRAAKRLDVTRTRRKDKDTEDGLTDRGFDPAEARDPAGRWTAGSGEKFSDEEHAKALKGVLGDQFEMSDDIPHFVGMSVGELNTVAEYSDSKAFLPVNHGLREGTPTPAHKDFAAKLNSALDRMPNFEGTTYRTGSNNPEVLKDYQGMVGKLIRERGFMSTGREGSTYLASGRRLVNFTVQGKTGKDISRIAKERDEKEVLFRSGTVFRIASVKKAKDGKYDVTLQER